MEGQSCQESESLQHIQKISAAMKIYTYFLVIPFPGKKRKKKKKELHSSTSPKNLSFICLAAAS